jgi:hypothetical protein
MEIVGKLFPFQSRSKLSKTIYLIRRQSVKWVSIREVQSISHDWEAVFPGSLPVQFPAHVEALPLHQIRVGSSGIATR